MLLRKDVWDKVKHSGSVDELEPWIGEQFIGANGSPVHAVHAEGCVELDLGITGEVY